MRLSLDFAQAIHFLGRYSRKKPTFLLGTSCALLLDVSPCAPVPKLSSLVPPKLVEVMTRIPHTLGADQSMSVAQTRMLELSVKHLPVVSFREDGREVFQGVVTELDLARLVSSYPWEHCPSSSASLACGISSTRFLTATPDTPFLDVLHKMVDSHADHTVVLEDEQVVGLLTSSDAMATLAHIIDPARNVRGISRVRDTCRRVQAEHSVIRGMLRDIVQLIGSIHKGDDRAASLLRPSCRELLRVLSRHMTLEEVVLLPQLSKRAGQDAELASHLTREHREIRELLDRVSSSADERSTLMQDILDLVDSVGAEVDREDRFISAWLELASEDEVTVKCYLPSVVTRSHDLREKIC